MQTPCRKAASRDRTQDHLAERQQCYQLCSPNWPITNLKTFYCIIQQCYARKRRFLKLLLSQLQVPPVPQSSMCSSLVWVPPSGPLQHAFPNSLWPCYMCCPLWNKGHCGHKSVIFLINFWYYLNQLMAFFDLLMWIASLLCGSITSMWWENIISSQSQIPEWILE